MIQDIVTEIDAMLNGLHEAINNTPAENSDVGDPMNVALGLLIGARLLVNHADATLKAG